MDNTIPILALAISLFGGMGAVIYNNLNNKAKINTEDIKSIKEKYVTKDDYNRNTDKMDAKLDKILDILIGGRNEN